MLNLESPLVLNPAAMLSPNLCDQFSDRDLDHIGSLCWDGYTRDDLSRTTWMRRNEAGMDLALQVQKDKSFPWPGCANIAFPIVTIAAMQFHARAYPALIAGEQVVKCTVFGDDSDGQATARSERVAGHMSWQVLHEDSQWEAQEDTAIFNVSIVGTTFKKSYYSAYLRHNVSELVLAKDLVLDYWAKSVEDCPRKTQRIPRFRNEVYENVQRGLWRDVLEEGWYTTLPQQKHTQQQARQDGRQGVAPPAPDETSSLLFLEQHVNLDLDNDGYAEPYIITFHEASKCVVRIVARFNSEDSVERIVSGPRKGNIIRIAAEEYFTQKTFIPSPDGGIYGIGFGVFLGPLNEAVNSLVNMLLDAGTMQTTAGGFLGRGAKIRGGVQTTAPFEWKRVDATGDDLRKSIFPLPVNAPSDVLFQLLSLLIDYSSRVSGTTDITVGQNPGQNTPAQTTQTMVEMGQKIYTAIFKRLWRSTKDEFQKLFILNRQWLPDTPQVCGATRADYEGSEKVIAPVADPNITSDSARVQIAMMLKQAAATTPGYDKDEVERRFLKSIRVEGIAAVFKGTQGQPPPEDPAIALMKVKVQGDMQVAQLDSQVKQAGLQLKAQELQVSIQKFTVELEEERRVNNAKIAELQASAMEKSASAQTEAAYAQVAMVNAEISRIKAENEHINTQVEHLLKAAEIQSSHHIGIRSLETKVKPT